MKTSVLLFISIWMLSICGYSQEITPDKVPANVKQGFDKKYPGASEVRYEMQKKNYLISFKANEIASTTLFNSYGKWMETRTTITEAEFPKKVTKSIAKNFKGFTMSDPVKVEKPDKVFLYGMIMKNETQGYEVLITSKGDVERKMPLKKEKTPKAEPEKK